MPGRFSRRGFLTQAAGAAGALAAGASSLAAAADAAVARDQPTLTMICWEGYADPSFVKPFEKMFNCTVKATYAGSSNEMFAKWKAGGGNNYDLVSASGDVTRRFMRSGTVMEIDVDKVPNYPHLYPKFHTPAWNMAGGKHYGVSFTWGPDPLIYDRKAFSSPPQSWSILYDKLYKGKLSTADNPITIADVALYLGYKDCYNLNEAQLMQVKKTLLAQKPLLRLYWGQAADLENAFEHHEVVASNGWPLMTQDLKRAHFPVGETIPREGATGWADTWMISTSSPNVQLALSWINYMIGAQGQLGVINVTGYAGASTLAAPLLGKQRVHELKMDDLSYFDRLHMWTEPLNYAEWVTIWNDVKG
jgi:putative spermidine/putrescine transport system substrate-binding protein/spermidine/putrescine transport system substrate-binding protein